MAALVGRSERSARVGARDGVHARARREPGSARAFIGRPRAAAPLEELSVGGRAGARGRIVVLVIGSSFLVSPSAVTLNERDTIVLADFENATGEPVFDGTLKVALAVGPRAVAVSQSVSRRAGARNASPDGALAGRGHHASGGARDRAARAAQGVAGRLDRAPRRELRDRTRSDQRADRRRHGARAGRSGDQRTGAERARRRDLEAAAETRRVAAVGSEVRRAAAARDDGVARRAPRLFAGALPGPRGSATGSDSSSEARDRAGSHVCDGARASVGGVREHRPVGARARILEEGVRPARPRQRSRALLHLLALLPRRDTGVGQGASSWRARGRPHIRERHMRSMRSAMRSSAWDSSSSRSRRCARPSSRSAVCSRRTGTSPRRCSPWAGSTRPEPR